MFSRGFLLWTEPPFATGILKKKGGLSSQHAADIFHKDPKDIQKGQGIFVRNKNQPRKSYANFATVFDVFVEIMDRIALLRPPSEEENRYDSMIYLRLIQTRVLTHRTLYKSGIQVMYVEIP